MMASRPSSRALFLLAFVALLCAARVQADTAQHAVATESGSEAFNTNEAAGSVDQLTRFVTSVLNRLEQQQKNAKGSLVTAVAFKSLRSTQTRLRKRQGRISTLKLARKNLSKKSVDAKSFKLLRQIETAARRFSSESRSAESKTKQLLEKYQKMLNRFEKIVASRAKNSNQGDFIALEVAASTAASVFQELQSTPARSIQNVFDLQKQRENESKTGKSHVGFKRAVAILRMLVGALKTQSSSYAAQRAAAGSYVRTRLSQLQECAKSAVASAQQAEDAQRLQQQTQRDLELADARDQAKEEAERVQLVKEALDKLKRESQRQRQRRQRLIRVLRTILNMLKGGNASGSKLGKAFKKAFKDASFSPYSVGPWSTCTAGCGVGKQTRSVKCSGSACVQPAPASSRPCFTRACPARCQVGPWLAWTECSKSCGRGVQVRRREVKTFGTGCPKLAESRPCEDQPCDA